MSSTCSWNGTWPLAVAHVHRRGGLAVGGQRDQAHIAGRLRGALLMDERDDCPRALIPADEWRHLPDRLGGEHLRPAGRCRRPRKPRCSAPAGPARPRNPAPPTGRSELGPAASSCDRARCSRLFTAAVLAPIASATSAAFHCSTSRSTSTARCRGERCCSAATNANRTDSREPTITDGSAGSSPTPATAPATAPRCAPPARRRIRTGCAQAGRQRPAAPALQRRQAGVGGDAVQPGAHRRLSLESVVGFPGAQKRLLHQILGIVQRTGHPIAMGEQFTPVGLGGGREIRIVVTGEVLGEHAHPSELTQCLRQPRRVYAAPDGNHP